VTDQRLRAALVSLACTALATAVTGQSLEVAAEPARPGFEVASVKPNTTDAPPSSRFPLGPGDAYLPGTLFSATNQPLVAYVRFAFGRSQGEALPMPSWVSEERFDILARAAGAPTKADMRLMVRALLADRFNLRWHVEEREQAVFELVLATPGRLGPRLAVTGSNGRSCEPDARPPGDAFDAIPCGSAGLVSASSLGRARISGRAEPIGRLAALLSNNPFAGVDRTVIDRTGLQSAFDFTVEWTPPRVAEAPLQDVTDDAGPSLGTALREQLGLTLRRAKAPIGVLTIEHIERPSPD
jgi:uncharacterized protein (TIGR03435 family)